MTKLYSGKDVDKKALKKARIAILGYGSQGRAHALNLKDSGHDVVVGVRKNGVSWKKAKKDGLKVAEPVDAVKGASLVAMLVPDLSQAELYNQVEKSLEKGASLLFAHGLNIHFKLIKPRKDLDVSLIAVYQNPTGNAFAKALAYGHGIGGTRGGVLETTFAEETETDLFGEQAVLCGGLSALIKAGFETLTEAGYPPEMAYFECVHEVKLIVDLIYQGGLDYMRYSISNTAEYGDLTRGSRVVTAQTKAEMKKILAEITSGQFAKEWRAEYEGGMKNFKRLYEADLNHPVETTGKRLRKMMPWLKAKEPPKQS